MPAHPTDIPQDMTEAICCSLITSYVTPFSFTDSLGTEHHSVPRTGLPSCKWRQISPMSRSYRDRWLAKMQEDNYTERLAAFHASPRGARWARKVAEWDEKRMDEDIARIAGIIDMDVSADKIEGVYRLEDLSSYGIVKWLYNHDWLNPEMMR